MEKIMEMIIHLVVTACEFMGITVVIISTMGAFYLYLKSLIKRQDEDIKFRLANGLALSLEFKMAAEILKTVLVRDMEELVVLGTVIILRALLSFLIHFEMKQDRREEKE